MAVKRRGTGRPDQSISALIERLPDRFLSPVLETSHGNMIGLQKFMADLDVHLRDELGLWPAEDPRSRRDHEPPVSEVMAAIGCPPSEWYRELLRE